MSVWAIADLHLSNSVPDKSMDLFGPNWVQHAKKIEKNWNACVKPEDLVLVAGDISWALKLQDVTADLNWIDRLPGQKVILNGNHDYWWPSNKKLSEILPPSVHFVHKNAFLWKDIAIGGARLWDTEEYNFDSFIAWIDREHKRKLSPEEIADKKRRDEAVFSKELIRFETSLQRLAPSAKLRIAMTHYPPIGPDLKSSRASALLKKYGISICVFGHLHNVKTGALPFGTSEGITYHLTSCDYIDFTPKKIL